ncbi:MAG TPA: hypothetical protein VF599_23530 [Pyrinomonadaceae bacterium]
MLKQILFVLFLLTAFLNASAQTVEEGTTAAGNSKLTAINLPNGALRVKDANIPSEIGEVLEKMVAQGGNRVRQGNREVLMWGGNYQKSKGAAMIEQLANAWRGAGWEYELAAEDAGVTFFTIFREEPARRALVGFFAPTTEAFVLALTEMLPNGSSNDSSAQTPDAAVEEPANVVSSPAKRGSAPNNLVGKWKRHGGAGGFRDYTGKTQYNSGEVTTFEFFADGSMQFLYEKNTLSITQCRISENTTIPGRFSVGGSEVTMNLGAGTSIGKSSCEAAGNFNKRLSASSVTKKFVIKELDSVFRPDRPVILCFDGSEDKDCFERTVK